MTTEARDFLKYYSSGEPDPIKIESLARLTDPRYLPSFNEVTGIFDFESDFLNSISDWKDFTGEYAGYNIYEYFTREYIEGLGSYLSERISKIHEQTGKKVTILDVCSGNGRLPFFLNQALQTLSDPEKFEVLAIDNKSKDWSSEEEKTFYEVSRMDCREGLIAFEPDIVLCSWMPGDYAPNPGRRGDWPNEFRQTPSVKEYILIGRNYWEEYYGKTSYEIPSDFVPAYIYEGFSRVDHNDLAKFQICFEDGPDVKNHNSVSTTVSFIRN